MNRYALIYVVLINLITFIMFFKDKHAAMKGKWRIPEISLFACAFLGGSLGGIAGMRAFRHKTKKLKFVIGFPCILIFEATLYFFAF
ncbi:MAG: DUF1294 domain-containing protein [Clostridia bacterium]|nr:DUF1294 domain-containing protein [Clostridia bacterium]